MKTDLALRSESPRFNTWWTSSRCGFNDQ